MMWKEFNINFTLANSIEVVNAIFLIKLLSQVLGCVTLQKKTKNNKIVQKLLKINISKFQFDRMQDLPENHFRVSGASWVNINN